jgi:hypothetical protein
VNVMVTRNTSRSFVLNHYGVRYGQFETSYSKFPIYLATEDHNCVIEVMVLHGVRRTVQQHQGGARPERDENTQHFARSKV